MPLAYEEIARRGGRAAIHQIGAFFMGDDPVHRSLDKITRRLTDLNIDYAIVGGLALALHGFVRATTDIALLVTPGGLKALHKALDGLGYVPPFAGSKHLRDTETAVRVEFLVTGQFPGDGVEKPIAFPDPAEASVEIDGLRVVSLERLIELKLACAMTNPGRVRDFGDVRELIRVKGLDEATALKLHEFVRPRFLELLQGLRDDKADIG